MKWFVLGVALLFLYGLIDGFEIVLAFLPAELAFLLFYVEVIKLRKTLSLLRNESQKMDYSFHLHSDFENFIQLVEEHKFPRSFMWSFLLVVVVIPSNFFFEDYVRQMVGQFFP